MKFQRSIFWLRRDLRLGDNVALSVATSLSKEVVLVFVFDTNILDRLKDKNDRRITIIHNSLLDLDQKLRKKGSALVVLLFLFGSWCCFMLVFFVSICKPLSASCCINISIFDWRYCIRYNCKSF